MYTDIFHTPEEAFLEDKVKACVREEIYPVYCENWTIVSYT